MTSTDFLLRYASVTTALFDHIEHDMQALACAFIDDDEASALPFQGVMTGYRLPPMNLPLN
ncbi:hypothetical protein [Massilia sp. H6]|uniref:hypothetical protein n=1 Tax=Massilia sp. H6 TaxID=2970464 RepID=UPI0021684663|nr:hypothetical protein [Massilia sp. H6]UVW27708.1 hypothetical protein NRS07_14300 [Massilia sp. H6]